MDYKKIRKRLRMSQADFAALLGVSEKTVWSLEQGSQMGASTLKRISAGACFPLVLTEIPGERDVLSAVYAIGTAGVGESGPLPDTAKAVLMDLYDGLSEQGQKTADLIEAML